MAENLSTFVVTYRYVPEMEHRRTPHRQDHLRWLRELAETDRLVLAGATRDPVDTAILIVRAEDAYAVRRLLLDDPYARASLIVDTTVRPIGLAVGG
ncbi:MAG: hypothetical protein HKP61_11830 [Dactylosporangium sp.]|nr:hypothetical protein [Dactylosporangium sp.]NNJ61613.1 hypothetical protein [Dactylosporangium sp.]